ncbi:Rossmann-like domain-containing protein [Geopsychrobacter electrodiphilus]|uniref:Rossmann-like domain-containing protein n=1 Tax=Geopsychrobacter electrodiphilus TaxID=225196 RepID=UPI000365868B|nr:DUF364 domain-containing protein [Geopsychrobacter electrodiphilus]
MSIMAEIRDMALGLASTFHIPKIAGIVFPPFHPGGQPHDCEFMAMALEGGAGGISYVLLPDSSAEAYRSLQPHAFIDTQPEQHAAVFGGTDPVQNMLGLAAINAICQQVMRTTGRVPEVAADSIGLMRLAAGDRVGMVGFFPPLLKYIQNCNVELVIIEKNPRLIERFPQHHVTLDITELKNCNKILCTSTTLLNDTLDEVLLYCSAAEHISLLGPTAGFFPDPLFAGGVHVLGGRFVNDGMLLLQLLAEGKRWGAATQKLCFEASHYVGIGTEGEA